MSFYVTDSTPFADEVITGLTGASLGISLEDTHLPKGWTLSERWREVGSGYCRSHWTLFRRFRSEPVHVSLPEFIEKLKEVL